VTGGRCDHWQGLIAMDLVGQITDEDRLALDAHLDGCAACRQEKRDLGGLARILPAADPDHLDAPEVPRQLESAVFDRLHAQARRDRRRRAARNVLGGAAAAVAVAALVFVLLATVGSPGSGRTIALSGRAGVEATAQLKQEPWGTDVRLRETGQTGGQVLTVSMRTTSGSWWAAGTYRTVAGRAVQVDLACAVPPSEIAEIWVRNTAGRSVLHGYVT
jgi:predicted anti-sigma-YlaC factor YlaD